MANGELGTALLRIFGDNATGQYIAEHGALIMTVVGVTIVLAIFFVAFFFDFIVDSWKMPIAAGIDALKYFSLAYPWLALLAAVLGALVFIYLCKDVEWLRWPFALLVVASCVLVYFLNAYYLAVVFAYIPIATVLMFVAAIID